MKENNLVIGRKHSGKSTTILYFMKQILHSNPKQRIIVINPKNENMWKKNGFEYILPKDYPDSKENLLQYVPIQKSNESHKSFIDRILNFISKIKYSIIIIDDASLIFNYNTTLQARSTFITVNQNKSTMYFMFHSIMLVPVTLYENVDNYFLFPTINFNAKKALQKLENETVIKCQSKINKLALQREKAPFIFCLTNGIDVFHYQLLNNKLHEYHPN